MGCHSIGAGQEGSLFVDSNDRLADAPLNAWPPWLAVLRFGSLFSTDGNIR